MVGPAVILPPDFTSKIPVTFPVLAPELVPAHLVVANDYNPNRVAGDELDLLEYSMRLCGVTQAVVTVYDARDCRYIVVDGFHRHLVMVTRLGLVEIPVVVLRKSLAERMASTIRHNDARGCHDPELMGRLVEILRAAGVGDHEVATRLGMEREELCRLLGLVGASLEG